MAYKKIKYYKEDEYSDAHLYINRYNDDGNSDDYVNIRNGVEEHEPSYRHYVNGILIYSEYYKNGNFPTDTNKPYCISFYSNGNIRQLLKKYSYDNSSLNPNLQSINMVTFLRNGNIIEQSFYKISDFIYQKFEKE